MRPLPDRPGVSPQWHARLATVVERTRADPPHDLAAVVRDELDVDVAARYAGIPIPHPFGKGSGQLSMTEQQIAADVRAGLAFVVLKTVVAESEAGARSMDAWADPTTRMTVEPIVSKRGRRGWTVTWTGRGWAGSLEEYAAFFARAVDIAREPDVPIIPSVKYHLPAESGGAFREDEYRHTTARLCEVWDRAGCGGPMVLEKDFSPTLAGDRRAGDREAILHWMRSIAPLIDQGAGGRVRLGVKVMNALFDDAFQVEMVRALVQTDPPPAFLVTFNRLYDPVRRVAYGGYDLSDRNLRVLDLLPQLPHLPPLSATGNICSGRMMLEYARRGCENGQLHTFFQLPLSEYTATGGSRTARALHTLLLHPSDGLAVWLRHLHEAGALEPTNGVIRFLDVVDGALVRG